MMDQSKSTLERAFELAESGVYRTVTEVRLRLRSEGYAQDQVTGRTLTRQLDALIKKARSKAEE